MTHEGSKHGPFVTDLRQRMQVAGVDYTELDLATGHGVILHLPPGRFTPLLCGETLAAVAVNEPCQSLSEAMEALHEADREIERQKVAIKDIAEQIMRD